MIKEIDILDNEEIHEKTQLVKKKIIQIEIDNHLAEIIHQYCAIKKWSQNYFIINAINREIIEEFVFIQNCGEYLDENENPVDFTPFIKCMERYFENANQKTMNELKKELDIEKGGDSDDRTS